MVSIISMSKYFYANIFHSICGGTHDVDIGDGCDRNPCSYKEDKNKDTHMSFVCSQHVVTIQDFLQTFCKLFVQFYPVSSTLGGRNLFLPGRFKPGFNPVSSARRKKPANPVFICLFPIAIDLRTNIQQSKWVMGVVARTWLAFRVLTFYKQNSFIARASVLNHDLETVLFP